VTGRRREKLLASGFAACAAVSANALLFFLMGFVNRPERPPEKALPPLRPLRVALLKSSLPRKTQAPRRPKRKRERASRRRPLTVPEPKLAVALPRMQPPSLDVALKPLSIELKLDTLEVPSEVAVSAAPSAAAAPAAAAGTEGGRATPAVSPARGLYDRGEVDEGPVRTRYVEPPFPLVARRRGLTGWVVVEFTVTEEGAVEKVKMVRSEGGKCFEEPALRAGERWRFRPARLRGRNVPVRCRVKILFELEK